MDIQYYLTDKNKLINAELQAILPEELEHTYPKEIYLALRYSLFAGGKRFRPILTLATAELLQGDLKCVLPAACAIELIHTYSLIHDDLPCMDNDDYRRGKPTSHKVFGEATATLAGNALLTLAFKQIAESGTETDDKTARILKELASASGFAGMVGGQMVDIESENKSVNHVTVEYIHRHKTGALICGAIRIGAILTEVSEKQLVKLTLFGNSLGLMFQITDDILDELGAGVQLKKTGKRDRARGKATYPRIIGLGKSREKVNHLFSECQEHLQPFGEKANTLLSIAELIANRIN